MNFKKVVSTMIASAVSIVSIATLTTSADETDRNRLYRIYDFSTDSLDGYYTLRHQSMESVNARSVTLPDDREPYTNSGIVFLLFSSTDANGTTSWYRGSGFIVSDHVIATAAHCIYDKDTSTFCNNAIVYLYNNSGTRVDTVTAVEAHFPARYISNANYPNYDYALLTVTEDLSEYEHFDLGVALDSAAGSTIPVNVAGFPGKVYDENNVEQPQSSLFVDTGTISSLTSHRIEYSSLDTSTGQSGAPIFVNSVYEINPDDDDTTDNSVTVKTAIGIHTTGHGLNANVNSGVRMTSELINFYKYNSNIDY